jgi:hypothetical protein
MNLELMIDEREKVMNLELMLDEIRNKQTIYNIHFCKAGVGIQFFDPPDNDPEHSVHWEQHVKTFHYYPTFRECIETEWARLVLGKLPEGLNGWYSSSNVKGDCDEKC